jgi:hypothetical protein
MTVWPVIIAAPAHRKKIVSAMSAGVQARLSGVRSIAVCLRSAGQSWDLRPELLDQRVELGKRDRHRRRRRPGSVDEKIESAERGDGILDHPFGGTR